MRSRTFVLTMTIAAICVSHGHGAHAASLMERQKEFLSLFEEFDWYKMMARYREEADDRLGNGHYYMTSVS